MNDDNDDILDTALAVIGLGVVATAAWKGWKSISNEVNNYNLDELFQQAVKFYNEGNHTDAIKVFAEIIQKDPNNGSAYNYVAWILAITKTKLPEAKNIAFKAINLAKTQEELGSFTNTLAEVYAQSGFFDEAIVEFRKCFTLFPNIDQIQPDYNTSFRIAMCYQAKGDIKTAYIYNKQALQVNPKNPFIYSNLAYICSIMERHNDSIEMNSFAVNLSDHWNFPDQNSKYLSLSNFFGNIGVSYYNLEKYEESWLMHEKAYQTYPNSPYALINLAALSAFYKRDKSQMRNFLEKGLILINPQWNWDLINYMLIDSDFEEFREIVLEMLKNHNLVNQQQYQIIMKNRSKIKSKSGNTNIYNDFNNSSFGAFAQGSDSNINGIKMFIDSIPKGEKKMNEDKNKRDINIDNSTLGGFTMGENSPIHDVTITINNSDVNHPKAKEIKDKLIDLSKAVENSDLSDFEKNDALDYVKKITKELEKKDETKQKEGVKYYLEKVSSIVQGVSPAIVIIQTIARLFGVPL